MNDGQYERRVALKVIRRGLDLEPMLRRFRAERQILASLEHPNIARLLDGGTSEDGQPFFVMEFIEGEPIDAYVRARELSIPDRLRLFLPVCDAVAHAHRHGIVHRDIKPANLLVTAGGVPKLLDFRIAKALTPDAPGATSSATGFRLLTPEYASPEQVEGQSATFASDVYSLGVILHELLTGGSPYRPRSRDPLDVADAVRTTIPQPPSANMPPVVRRQLRGDLDTIVLSALRREPARRYAKVDDLAADIRRHLDGLPIRARRDSMPYRMGKFLKRNRSAVAAAGLAVLATSLLAVFIALRVTRAEPSLLQSGAVERQDRIVVGRFTEPIGDTLLGAAITEAFRIDLTQSPNVRVLTPARIRSALERMQHGGDHIPNDSVARELALREGAKAYVTGSIARLGGAWTLSVQLVSAAGDEELTALHHGTGLDRAGRRRGRGQPHAAPAPRRDAARSRRHARARRGYDRLAARPPQIHGGIGVLLLAEGRAADAERALREAADRHLCPICPLPDLARAPAMRGDDDAVLATWRAYIETPWLWRYETDAVELGPALVWMGQLHERRGEPEDAETRYEQHLALWARADGPAEDAVARTRERLARLKRRAGA